MTRWLQAAKSAQRTTDETDKTDETPSAAGFRGRNPLQAEVSSVVSVLSVERTGAKTDARGNLLQQRSAGRFLPENNGARPEPTPPELGTEAWASMTDLERYGPRGVLFCGNCRQARGRDTALQCLEGRSCR